MPQRKGDWIVTYTGLRFYPFDPRPEEVEMADIAHSLSLQTRWTGHCRSFYSIASHSVACAKIAEAEKLPIDTVRWALMHDAAEAYIGDIARPVKRALFAETPDGLTAVSAVEDAILEVIAERFELTWPMPIEVKEIDLRMLVTEAKCLTNYCRPQHWTQEKPWMHTPLYSDDVVLSHHTIPLAERAFHVYTKKFFVLS